MIIMKLGASFCPVWLSWHRAESERSLVVLLPIMGKKKKKKKAYPCIRHTFLISHCFPSLGPDFLSLESSKTTNYTAHVFKACNHCLPQPYIWSAQDTGQQGRHQPCEWGARGESDQKSESVTCCCLSLDEH